MTKEQLFDLIGQAHEIYIRDAAQGKKRKQRWTIWGAAAACLVLVGVILWQEILWQEWPAAEAVPPRVTYNGVEYM